jgi:hypothetical protein
MSGHESKQGLEVYLQMSLRVVEQDYQEAVKSLGQFPQIACDNITVKIRAVLRVNPGADLQSGLVALRGIIGQALA